MGVLYQSRYNLPLALIIDGFITGAHFSDWQQIVDKESPLLTYKNLVIRSVLKATVSCNNLKSQSRSKAHNILSAVLSFAD